MKYKILPSFAFAALFLTTQSFAQNNTAFAVTGQTKGNYNWNVIREIDLSTGEVVRTIYDPLVNKSVNYQAAPGTELETRRSKAATGSGVAATAYDAVHNRLYFTDMRAGELLYFDLANDLTVVVNNSPSFNTGTKSDEANVITRMAFAADGFGYAITNDGKSFIRFTTDQKPSVTNLGQLIDGKKNGSMSVHEKATSWGGDMVGDAYGNLYLVTYRNHVYKINPNTRVADYLGQLKGIPAEFTSNGMVVTAEGEVIVSSASLTDNYYKINMSTLDAVPLSKTGDKVYNSSDLANGNLLYQTKTGPDRFVVNEIKGNNAISMYPNPATNKTFNVQFGKVPMGKYNLVLTDASGRNVLTKALTIGANGQVEKISLPRTSGSGMYLIKLTGDDHSVVYSDKIVVQ